MEPLEATLRGGTTDQHGNILASYNYDIRADGKRTGLTETFWLDENADGVRDAAEVKTTDYDWTYDAVGRLTDEAITHFDSSISQAERFEYDLTGNRTKLEKDLAYDGTFNPDEVFTYDYDANDRLTFEYLDNNGDAVTDQTTAYTYDHTQQTSKVTSVNSVPSVAQFFTYNLQGRMASVVNEGYDGAGILNSRTRTSYGKRSICPAWAGPTECRRLPENAQVAVAGSLGVLQVLAQVIDRLDIAACFTFDARVAQVAD